HFKLCFIFNHINIAMKLLFNISVQHDSFIFLKLIRISIDINNGVKLQLTQRDVWERCPQHLKTIAG
ncbi:MAG: hypothetical protein M3015_06500, partial [Bacteroidota bacterium]|nr:hypothetical protein [Bacteroidota bacterium]